MKNQALHVNVTVDPYFNQILREIHLGNGWVDISTFPLKPYSLIFRLYGVMSRTGNRYSKVPHKFLSKSV